MDMDQAALSSRLRRAVVPLREVGLLAVLPAFSHLYTDADGNLMDAPSFVRDDLPLVCKVLDRAHSWIFASHAQQQGTQTNGESSDQPIGDDIPF